MPLPDLNVGRRTRVLIDARPLQTSTAKRGIGRYTLEFCLALARRTSDVDISILLEMPSGGYLGEGAAALTAVLGNERIVWLPRFDHRAQSQNKDQLDILENDIKNLLLFRGGFDVFHCMNPFESDAPFGHSSNILRFPPCASTCTVYDFIPALFPEHYLQHPTVAEWYRERLEALPRFQRLFAISQATGRDAMRLVGLDGERVVNVGTGADAELEERVQEAPGEHSTSFLKPDGPFLYYVGGPDYRKNISSIIRALQALTKAGRDYKLVVTFDGDERERNKIAALGISYDVFDRILFTGYLSDGAIRDLYRSCSFFIFPSLYEGFGLPVVEALAAGARVLVSDNSALPELVPNLKLRFDAADPQSIADTILWAEDNYSESVLGDLRAHVSAHFTWSLVAERAILAWNEIAAAPAKSLTPPRPRRIAMFSPIPPQRTGVARYAADLLSGLADIASVDVFSDVSIVAGIPANCRAYHHSEFETIKDNYDTVIYQIGNSPFHSFMLPYMKRFPGIIDLHEASVLNAFYFSMTKEDFVSKVCSLYGSKGRRALRAAEKFGYDLARENLVDSISFLKAVLENAEGVIVHSSHTRDRVLLECGYRRPAIEVVQQPYAEQALEQASPAANDDRFTFVVPGFAAETKGILEIVEAFASVKKSRPDIRLRIVGELDGGAYGDRVRDCIKRENLGNDDVVITGYVGETDYHAEIAGGDAIIVLRALDRGESSRSVLDGLASGRPVIINTSPVFADVPDEVVLRLSKIDPAEIAAAMEALCANRDVRLSLAHAAREYWSSVHRPSVVAHRYLDALQAIAASRIALEGRTKAAIHSYTDVAMADRGQAETWIARAYGLQAASRIYIDVSQIHLHDRQSGIERTVKQLVRGLAFWDSERCFAEAVTTSSGQTVSAPAFRYNSGISVAHETTGHGEAIDPRCGDWLIFADATFHLDVQQKAAAQDWVEKGGRIGLLIYDILPLTQPDLFLPFVTKAVEQWLSALLPLAARIAFISQTVQREFTSHFATAALEDRKPGRIATAVTHLGGNFTERASDTAERVTSATDTDAEEHIFRLLIVGTLEPRKGHALLLEAFDLLRLKGVRVELTIVGRIGWGVERLSRRISNHVELGRDLKFLGLTSDAELKRQYRRADLVVVPAIAEGYGLPVLEGLSLTGAVLCSDIEVFREIAGNEEGVVYFSSGSAIDLAAKIELLNATRPDPARLTAHKTWEEFVEDFHDFFVHGRSDTLTWI
ncbi:D-inositol-3-phosphate glycosyltransferase [Alphaproteobacteria bacterium SO-S41]|nr:D-inositol-3-phosphate glycosyltransferase [Alphaproteobacteria bacterium SO-S41]